MSPEINYQIEPYQGELFFLIIGMILVYRIIIQRGGGGYLCLGCLPARRIIWERPKLQRLQMMMKYNCQQYISKVPLRVRWYDIDVCNDNQM